MTDKSISHTRGVIQGGWVMMKLGAWCLTLKRLDQWLVLHFAADPVSTPGLGRHRQGGWEGSGRRWCAEETFTLWRG